MKRLLFYMGIFTFLCLFNVTYLQGSDVPDVKSEEGHDISFEEVHGWPEGRCEICHISPRPAAESAALKTTDISMLCESCHQGKVTILPASILRSEVKKMANHPIKFSPLDFSSEKINHTVIEEKKQFYISGKTGKVPIFGATAATAVVECATCHESHDRSHMPKLPRISNAKGEMCLVCHLIDIRISEYFPDTDINRIK